MDVSRDGKFAVSGEVGPKPWVCYWSTETAKVVWKKNSPLEKGITAIGINSDGTVIAAISMH
jgi:hypothetical protein